MFEIRNTIINIRNKAYILKLQIKPMEAKHIKKFARKGIETLEYGDCFVTEVQVNGNKVEIFLDSDEGISFLKCRKVSREVEAVIDEKKWWEGKYTLEVSSAGIGRPLVNQRQYPKNIGRQMVVKTNEGEKVKGELKEVSDEGIVLTYEVIELVGQNKKKKKKVQKDHPIIWVEIEEAKIKASF